MKCRKSNREVSFIYIHSAAGAAAAAAALCCFTVYFSFCYVDTVCGFTTEYLDLIDYNYYTAARRTSMYSYIPACCCVVCCYTAVAVAAAACCCCSSSCANGKICFRGSLHLIPVFSFSSSKHDFIFNVPLDSTVAFSASIF